jgi:FkbM family methyltransferase
LQGRKVYYTDAFSFLWQFHEIFVKKHYSFQASTEKPTIIDCGSNVGLSLIYLKTLYPKAKIISFEPNPQVFEILTNNIVDRYDDIELRQEAVWIKNEQLTFRATRADDSAIHVDGDLFVKAVNINDILQEYKKIDFLKMDIEGAEAEVFPAMEGQLRKISNIFIEYHSTQQKPQNISVILAMLEAAGFKYIFKHEYDYKEPLKYLNQKRSSGFESQVGIFATKPDFET